MHHDLPTIRTLCRRLLLDVNVAVKGFPRDHRYDTGAELRSDAREISRAADRAWFGVENRPQHVQELVRAVDNLKLTLQLAKDLKAFRGGGGQFDMIWRLVVDLGQQCGGWHRRQNKHHKGQNSATRNAAPERAKRLSARAASNEANV